ncbi:MAG: penicillin acylase family protein, partial [Terracidiphilus sp.]|nr:penicillin acylase family protein [Terracidiphilus sp.]
MSDSSSSTLPAPQAAPRRRRNSRWPRILLYVAGSLLLLLLVAAGAAVLWLRSAARAALPQLDGDIHLDAFSAPVLSAPVIVRRDAHGVPHIEATTQEDLFVAQGYVTAQDRLWQMDASRRAANGNLAEILGPSLVTNDKTQRVLQIRLTAQRIYEYLSPADRARIDAYARGVNLYISQCEKSHTLPPEFRLLGYHPQAWTGEDSVSVGLLMVETLDSHVTTKLTRAHVEAKLLNNPQLGPQLIADLYPVGSWRDHPPTGIKVDLSAPQPQSTPSKKSDDEDDDENTETRIAPSPALSQFASKTEWGAPEDPAAMLALRGWAGCENCAVGSNNWVIAGSHTASGKPLLSNDMHLTLRVPDTWYMADLRAPGFHTAGVSLPGMPFIVAGHNEHVAWGYTALLADVQDLYTEKLDGKGNYEGLDAAWHPLAVDRETIHVRGGRDVVVEVQSTVHGPLLHPLLAAGDPPLALKWTLYDPSLNALPLYEMNTASNWTEFSAALEQWNWPTQNLVYADDQGHTAYHAIGKVPIRGGGAGVFDTPVPHETRNEHYGWGLRSPDLPPLNYIPFDDLPNALDPPSGFLATANSRVTT